MGDRAFVEDAAKRWEALLKTTEKWDGDRSALALSLWATLNVDRLIEIARRAK